MNWNPVVLISSSTVLVSPFLSKWNLRTCTLVWDFCTDSSVLREIAITGQLRTQKLVGTGLFVGTFRCQGTAQQGKDKGARSQWWWYGKQQPGSGQQGLRPTALEQGEQGRCWSLTDQWSPSKSIRMRLVSGGQDRKSNQQIKVRIKKIYIQTQHT